MKRFLQFVVEADVASVNIGDTNITADKKANTINMSTKIGDDTTFTASKDFNPGGSATIAGTTKIDNTTVTASKDLSPGGATTFGATHNLDKNTTLSASHSTPAYNKGQLGGVSSMSATHKDDQGVQHNITMDKGIGFGGAGKDVQQNRNMVTSYRKNNMNVATKFGGDRSDTQQIPNNSNVAGNSNGVPKNLDFEMKSQKDKTGKSYFE